MASMSIAFGASSVSQFGPSQQAVAQARRAVEQAQRTATAENSNAREARAAVERAQANVQTADARASQSAAQASQAQQRLASLNGASQQVSLVPKYEAIASNLPSMLNNQGQRLGTLVNATA